jgi:acyl-CoA reductase-like NAD-dependent aldehyde dehydrogenase
MMDQSSAFIGGAWRGGSGGSYDIINPATGDPIGTASACSERDVVDAVDAASAVQPSWAATTFAERADLLRAVALRLEKSFDDFVNLEVAETGTTLSVTTSVHVDATVQRLRRYAALDESVLEFAPQPGFDAGVETSISRVPCGVVAAISPYNFPLLAMMGKVAAALLSGNAVVMKPAPQDPLGVARLTGLFEESGLPGGVLNLVTGPGAEIGRALVTSPGVDLVSFTGSTSVGEDIFRSGASTMKKLYLELGGKGACVILDDADLDRVVGTLQRVWTINAGQVCLAPTRAIVHESLHDELVERLVSVAQSLVIGDPMDSTTQVGPLISASQRERVDSCVREALDDGGRAVAGGRCLEGPGFFYAPTLVDAVLPGSSLDQHEAFGPVIAVETFRDDGEALAIANGTIYGLHDYVFGVDVERAVAFSARLKGASVTINGFRRHPEVPFGGNRMSGVGRSGGVHGLLAMTTPRVVNIQP